MRVMQDPTVLGLHFPIKISLRISKGRLLIGPASCLAEALTTGDESSTGTRSSEDAHPTMSGAACASIAPPRALTQRRTLRNALAAERTAVAVPARNARARRNRGTNLTTCQADLGGPSEPHVRGRDISTWALSRRAWATVTDLGSTLPPLLPWAAERVATWQEAWQKASALASNMPIAVVDLMPVEGQENENKSPFETKIGAYIYDKGYRQLFRALGYPGADAEAALALVKINRPEGESSDGRICLDLSCGPGIITTRLASGLRGYEILVASDVSEAMTRRAAEQLDAVSARSTIRPEPDAAPLPNFAAVRADVTAMPFRDSSVDAVHCSAGAHCWLDPMDGLREVERILKPGGVFVTSTVVLAPPIREKYVKGNECTDAESYDDDVRTMNTPFWDTASVVAMLQKAGLKGVEIVKEDKCFVMLAARKP